MSRTLISLIRKCATLMLAAVFVLNAFLLSGCSGDKGEGAGSIGTSTITDDVTGETASDRTDAKYAASDVASQESNPTAPESADVKPKGETPAGNGDTSGFGTGEKGLSVSDDDPVRDNGSKPDEEPGSSSEETVKLPEDTLAADTEKKPSATGTQVVLSADDDSIWANSFLLFLPRFSGGTEEGRIAEETFDHILLNGIESKRSIEDYVEELKSAGFNIDADYVDHNGKIDFHAFNADGWYATVDYDINTAKADIACGFFKEEKEKGPEDYFGEEILAVLPFPDNGTLSGGKTDGDYPYVLFADITLEDALAYAKKLKKAGFDTDVLEGEANDLCWYNASGHDGLICDMQYADGILMIGCDRVEE
ncbi:MAG: hypothetical protein K6F44_06530 [Lachnospiraceae bacterium]|nr:hypothetical protein [Lachnospiraceae bacterium]